MLSFTRQEERAIRIAAELIFSAHRSARAHIGLPTWPNHTAIFETVGLQLATYPYFDTARQVVLLDRVLSSAASTQAGDVFVLHGPGHNPTGCDLSDSERREVHAQLASRGAIPLIDFAYYGLAEGLDADLRIARDVVENSERAVIAASCSKAFGLYRERVGVLLVVCANAAERGRVQGLIERLSRILYSMAPSHGASAVHCVLSDPSLRAQWLEELESMRKRLASLRRALAQFDRIDALRAVGRQRGLFSLLPLSSEQVDRMARDFGIYMPRSGRINIAGLRSDDVVRFCAAVSAVAK